MLVVAGFHYFLVFIWIKFKRCEMQDNIFQTKLNLNDPPRQVRKPANQAAAMKCCVSQKTEIPESDQIFAVAGCNSGLPNIILGTLGR